ncbi:ProQ/FINO family protein [Vibrio sp. 1CM23M]|uniref:ProQ/FINO family protein n=1 Tax=Vibrio sp. 1CM23M TaxID=2929164 RepID=UPI0020BF3620|nr:ProQ/FINO family protein [Vibrio sp. 1CM23M]MCK8072443.1 ProQ/FinO family protein [Vibrio sp. 1CM23M]
MKLPSGEIGKFLYRLKAEHIALRKFKPLEIGIHKQVIELYSDEYSSTFIRKAIARHTADPRYSENFSKYTHRYNIHDEPAVKLKANEAIEQMDIYEMKKKKIKASIKRKAENIANQERLNAEAAERRKSREKAEKRKATKTSNKGDKNVAVTKKRKTLSLKR